MASGADIEQPPQLVESALAIAAPGVELVVVLDEEHRGNLRWAQNGLTTNGLTRSSAMTVAAVIRTADGVRTASVSRPVASPRDVRSLVDDSTAAARSAAPSLDEAGTALAEGVAASDFSSPSPALSAQVFEPLVEPLAHALQQARVDEVTWSGYAEATMDSTWLGTSTGVRQVHHQPAGRVEITSRSRRTDGRTVSTWAGQACERFEQISIPDLAERLANGRRWSATDVATEPGRHTVILTPSAVADLVIPALWAASARDAAEGRSAFGHGTHGTRIGQRVMGSGVDVVSDPFDGAVPTRSFVVEHASGPSSSLLDNGAELGRTEWIRDGVLQHLIGPRWYRRSVAEARPVIDNVLISAPGSGSLADLIARTEDALLITCFWYIRDVDPQSLLLTGLTRDGVFRVRNGEVVGAAPNFRFNVSPLEVMSNIEDGTDASRTQPREWGDYVHRVVAPGLRVSGFNLSTGSDAR